MRSCARIRCVFRLGSASTFFGGDLGGEGDLERVGEGVVRRGGTRSGEAALAAGREGDCEGAPSSGAATRGTG